MKTTNLPDDVLAALEKNGRGPGWHNRKPDVQRFTLPNPCPARDPCTLLVVPAVAFTRNAERASDERMHGRCLWWDEWAHAAGWAIGNGKPPRPVPNVYEFPRHGDAA